MAPIHFRIIKHRRIRYISSKIMLEQKYWSDLKNGVKPSHPNSTRINSLLANRLAELQDEVYGYETKEKSLRVKKVDAENLSIRALVDVSSIEKFIVDGKDVFTEIFFPNKIYSTLEIINTEKSSSLLSGEIKAIKEVW